MRTTFSHVYYVLITTALILSACNLPAADSNTQDVPATEAVIVDVTATVDRAATETREAELIPTDTPPPTPTETLTPEPSATSTPEALRAEVVRETNCRTGPAGNYDLVAKYQAKQILEVMAMDQGSAYWFVKNPEKPEEQCYLLVQNVKVVGDTETLPKFTPMPSPTAMPYFKLTFKKFDTCEGLNYAVFTVENVGSIPFRSLYIKVTNQKIDKSVEAVMNAFDLKTRCVLAKNIAPLNPGETGYAYSPQFKWSGHGEKLRAVIMACTDKNLKGSCVTQTYDIKE